MTSHGYYRKIVSIHTPTKGVTFCVMVLAMTVSSFNPHTHEGCDIHNFRILKFNRVSIHTPTKGVTLAADRPTTSSKVSIHTPTKGVTSQGSQVYRIR